MTINCLSHINTFANANGLIGFAPLLLGGGGGGGLPLSPTPSPVGRGELLIGTNQEIRFDLGVIFAEETDVSAEDGMAYQTIGAGRWAIFTHVGPYDTLWQTWQAVCRDWLPTSDYELRDAIPFENYIDDPASVESAKLRTQIYLPII